MKTSMACRSSKSSDEKKSSSPVASVLSRSLTLVFFFFRLPRFEGPSSVTIWFPTSEMLMDSFNARKCATSAALGGRSAEFKSGCWIEKEIRPGSCTADTPSPSRRRPKRFQIFNRIIRTEHLVLHSEHLLHCS